ncbi:hypothetical protein DVH24_016016 [Malus domestica]|uniref:Uncharacterized protein n=1 Tax=Malus domestica TaxID=3750 RepID=A0A498JDM0_MALDO|nr:hypothetical protein DVH24_016016 [Malus domestica]
MAAPRKTASFEFHSAKFRKLTVDSLFKLLGHAWLLPILRTPSNTRPQSTFKTQVYPKYHLLRLEEATEGTLMCFCVSHNFDTLLYIFNAGHSTSFGAKSDQTDEFWTDSNWRMFMSLSR